MSIQDIHKNKKILILGSNGNLGQQLVKVFKKENKVIAWGRNEADITDKKLIINKIKSIHPDIIINATAYNNVDKCEEDDDEFEIARKINGQAIKYLAQAAIEIGAILINYSSDYVFRGDKKEGYNEEDEPAPINKYGETKLMGEKIIFNLAKEKGLKYYIIRTSKLFGSKGKSVNAKDSFFDIMLQLAREKDELNVVDEEVSCFTYTIDLAEATCELIKEKKEWGIYHIVNSGACTWYEATQELLTIARINVNLIPVNAQEFNRPAKRPKYSVLISNKIKPLRNYKEALKEYLG